MSLPQHALVTFPVVLDLDAWSLLLFCLIRSEKDALSFEVGVIRPKELWARHRGALIEQVLHDVLVCLIGAKHRVDRATNSRHLRADILVRAMLRVELGWYQVRF